MPFAALIAEWTVVHSSLGLLKGREEQTNLSHPKPSPSPLYSIFMFVDGRSWMQWYRESCPGRDCLMTYSITRSLSWILGWKSDKSEHKIRALLKNLEKKSVMTEMRMISLFCSETRLILFRVAMFCWVTLSATQFPRPPLLFPWRSAVTWDARNP